MTAAVFDEVGGFDPELRRLVDWDLVAGVVARHPFRVRHVDQVLCDYYLFLAEGGAPTLTNLASATTGCGSTPAWPRTTRTPHGSAPSSERSWPAPATRTEPARSASPARPGPVIATSG
jgi:hypothetical protein